jgi:hypothetical protein
MKQLLQSIQQQLQTAAPVLKYVNRDWGQMNLERPPVKYPCALLNIQQVEINPLKTGPGSSFRLRLTVSVTVVTQRQTGNPSTRNEWLILDAVHQVMDALVFTDDDTFTPLVPAGIETLGIDASHESIQLTFTATKSWI